MGNITTVEGVTGEKMFNSEPVRNLPADGITKAAPKKQGKATPNRRKGKSTPN
jgi:hypothetical protein